MPSPGGWKAAGASDSEKVVNASSNEHMLSLIRLADSHAPKKPITKVRINGKDTCYYFETAREAAKKVDLELIKSGKQPINGILSKAI